VCFLVSGEELRCELAKALDQKLEHVRQAQKRMRNALKVAWRIVLTPGMILLPIAQDPMAVSAYWGQHVIEGSARNVMKFHHQWFFDATKGATRFVCPQPFAGALLATLAVQFKIIHGLSSFQTTMR
jgi:hypothetical protein